MKLNSNPRNICEAWDLSDSELNKFYKGAGVATIVINTSNDILTCYYHDNIDDNQELDIKLKKGEFAYTGMMSCHQFCCDAKSILNDKIKNLNKS